MQDRTELLVYKPTGPEGVMIERIARAAIAAMLLGVEPTGLKVDDLAWMSGRWEAAGAERWTEEYWSSPRAGVMMGFSRSGRGSANADYEHLRLQAGHDGVPVYWAAPGGRQPVAFRLVRADRSSATFENSSHDYPQRISYRRIGDTMVATISARDGSNASSWTFQRR